MAVVMWMKRLRAAELIEATMSVVSLVVDGCEALADLRERAMLRGRERERDVDVNGSAPWDVDVNGSAPWDAPRVIGGGGHWSRVGGRVRLGWEELGS